MEDGWSRTGDTNSKVRDDLMPPISRYDLIFVVARYVTMMFQVLHVCFYFFTYITLKLRH